MRAKPFIGAMKFWGFIAAFCCCFSFALPGCSIQMSEMDVGDDRPLGQISGEDQFGYDKMPIEPHISLIEGRGNYEILYVTFPSYYQDDADNKLVRAWYYKQKDPSPTANIIQLPILGGDYAPSRFMFEYLAEKGFNVLFFERKNVVFDPNKGLNRTWQVLVRTIVDVRRGLDWWLTQPEIDPEKIGILGISMGGIQASILMGVDNRIKAGVFALNGGNLPKLVSVSKEGEVIEFREAAKKQQGWTDEQFHQAAVERLSGIDPIRFAPNLNPEKVLHISPRFDQVVPYELANQWYEAAHQPNRIVLPTGHYSAVIFITYIRKNAYAFLADSLGVPRR